MAHLMLKGAGERRWREPESRQEQMDPHGQTERQTERREEATRPGAGKESTGKPEKPGKPGEEKGAAGEEVRGQWRIWDKPAEAARAAELLKALAHPLRLSLVALLCAETQNVTSLAEKLGVQRSIVSQQLRILRMHRLVSATRKDGRAIYKLTEPRLEELMRCLEGCTASRGS